MMFRLISQWGFIQNAQWDINRNDQRACGGFLRRVALFLLVPLWTALRMWMARGGSKNLLACLCGFWQYKFICLFIMAELLENTLNLNNHLMLREVTVWENGMLLVQHGARQLICSQHVPLKMWMVFLCELDELDPFAIEPIAIPDFKMVQWMKLVCDDAEENSWKGGKEYFSEVYVARQKQIFGDTSRLWQRSKHYSWSYFEGLEKSFQSRHYRKRTFIWVWCSVRGKMFDQCLSVYSLQIVHKK